MPLTPTESVTTDVMNVLQESNTDTVLIVEQEVLVRNAIAEYLRHCGYRVLEAMSAQEAVTVMENKDVQIDILFSAVEMSGGMDGFGLSQWARRNRPGIHVILAGNIVSAAASAGELCQEGPHLKKPYEPQAVVDWIKKLKAFKP